MAGVVIVVVAAAPAAVAGVVAVVVVVSPPRPRPELCDEARAGAEAAAAGAAGAGAAARAGADERAGALPPPPEDDFSLRTTWIVRRIVFVRTSSVGVATGCAAVMGRGGEDGSAIAAAATPPSADRTAMATMTGVRRLMPTPSAASPQATGRPGESFGKTSPAAARAAAGECDYGVVVDSVNVTIFV